MGLELFQTGEVTYSPSGSLWVVGIDAVL